MRLNARVAGAQRDGTGSGRGLSSFECMLLFASDAKSWRRTFTDEGA